ncbi:hypothetical protein ColLi_10686 [Colletotrichum liriopes]|uniref:Uncharacterized protein n=1 Tax=Colletotrichum liriopes TaxID=708192 RepID=A0AA37GXG4_9PEZI|nr:hypothetical protein ColLi_10686 [Colletotrichum liriopes]
MRLTLSHAVVFGLLAAISFSHAYPHKGDLNRQAEITVDSTLGRGADEANKRRYALETIYPRGIPKLGEKPKNKDSLGTLPGGKPGSGNGGNGGGAGKAPGTGTATKLADENQEKARAKGEALSNELDQAIFTNAAAPDLGYKLTDGKKAPVEVNHDYLKNLGIKATDEDTWYVRGVFRAGKDNVSKRNLLIFETITDAGQGAVVVKQSWKDRDQSPPKATWTDMIHDNWMLECQLRGQDPKSMKYIVRDNIQFQTTEDSKGIMLNTQKAIDDVYDMLGADKTKTLKIDAKSDNSDVKASYQLLSAQTHVARVLQWLKDRHGDLGDKKIASLDVNHIDHISRMYSIVIILA